MSISSRQLNYLVWRYLQESGFELSSYALQKEAHPQQLEKDLGEKVAMGTLITLVQKGIQLTQLEQNVQKPDSVRSTADRKVYTLLNALDQELVEPDTPSSREYTPPSDILRDKDNEGDQEMENSVGKESTPLEPSNEIPTNESNSSKVTAHQPQDNHQQHNNEPNWNTEVVYEGAPVSAAQWSKDTVAVGSTNVELIDMNTKNTVTLAQPSSIPENEVTVISWSHDGSLLATASFDGQISVWTSDGKLRHVLSLHGSPVLVLKWNDDDSSLLSVDCTNRLVVWDSASGDIRQRFQPEPSNLPLEAPPSTTSSGTDAGWIDSTTYAATDGVNIVIYKLGEPKPLLQFQGHSQGINSIEFDTYSQLLCSGSDDHTVRIWNGKASVPVHTLVGHSGPVLATRWLMAPDSLSQVLDPEARRPAIVASASIDGTIRVWDAYSGQCLNLLNAHKSPIFFCELSPNGKYIASAAVDGVVMIWDFSKGPQQVDLVARHEKAPGGEASGLSVLTWSEDSTRLFVSYGKGVVLKLANDL
uniref:ARAD1B23892p n=1 Tax=Blastobotrys adeninivorans TaxID=409370 RepID=A0A060T7H3_BLAAD